MLTNPGNTFTGNTTVSAGTLRLDASGSFANSPTITVGTTFGPILDVGTVSGGPNYNPSLVSGGSFSLAISQRLKGSGTVSGKAAIASGSFLAPGNSIGTITFDSNTTIAGTLEIEAASPASVDLLQLTGAAGLMLTGSSVLALAPTNTYDGTTPLTIAQTAGGLISGQFGSVQNLPNGYDVVYNSNSIMIAPVPEPGSLILGGMAAATGFGIWRRKRKAPATI